VTAPTAFTEYEKNHLGSTLPDSLVQGSPVIYKISFNDGIWPIIAAFTGRLNISKAHPRDEKRGVCSPKKGFNLFTGLYFKAKIHSKRKRRLSSSILQLP
jgi:hypothetical protein